MIISDFINNFIDLFDDLDSTIITPETIFRDINGWSSLIALSTMSMIDDEYDVQLSADQMRRANTIQELYDLVISKM
jgi:acyl carrier protein